MARRRAAGGWLSPKRIDAGVFAFGEARVGFEVILESRRDTRFSLTQRRAYCRLPYGLNAAGVIEQRHNFEAWLRATLARRPGLQAVHTPTAFSSGEVWRLGEYGYRLMLDEADVKGASAKTRTAAVGDAFPTLSISLPVDLSTAERSELIERLLFRMLAKRMQATVETEVAELNDEHFRVPVTRVRLSATTSRWGSCSSNGTVSLSTRLLGAPGFCRKAVIIHELAHGREMNHSDRFWKLVYAAMPDYDAADAWLKEHGAGIGWEKFEGEKVKREE